MLGIGFGVPFYRGGGAAGGIVTAFYDRVIADGGTFEAEGCLTSFVAELLSYDQIATTFNMRVIADSGTLESINCLQTFITSLLGIYFLIIEPGSFLLLENGSRILL